MNAAPPILPPAEDAIEAMIGLNRPGVIYDLDELRANIHATATEYGVSR